MDAKECVSAPQEMSNRWQQYVFHGQLLKGPLYELYMRL